MNKMTRNMRRAAQKNGERLQALPWNDFVDVTKMSHERHVDFGGTTEKLPGKVFQNNKYIVQCHLGHTKLGLPVTLAMIRRSDAQPLRPWQDMQRIKNEVFGDEAEAFEMYPKVSELIDVANLYWMWVIDSTVKPGVIDG